MSKAIKWLHRGKDQKRKKSSGRGEILLTRPIATGKGVPISGGNAARPGKESDEMREGIEKETAAISRN